MNGCLDRDRDGGGEREERERLEGETNGKGDAP